MTRETKHKTKCIPLRKFMEEYFKTECEACKEVIKQTIVVLETFCIHELISDSKECISRESGPRPIREVEFVNSPEKAVEVLKKFGLSEEEARELVSRVA